MNGYVIPTSQIKTNATYHDVQFATSGLVGATNRPIPLAFSADFLWEKLHQEIFTFIDTHFDDIAIYYKKICSHSMVLSNRRLKVRVAVGDIQLQFDFWLQNPNEDVIEESLHSELIDADAKVAREALFKLIKSLEQRLAFYAASLLQKAVKDGVTSIQTPHPVSTKQSTTTP